MSKELPIYIAAKRATYLGDLDIVCNNSDYEAVFTFEDDDWDSFVVKTAHFSWNGHGVDTPFKGNRCPVPPVRDTSRLTITVFAGDIRTTTGAIVTCVRSGLCGDEPLVAPEESVYNKLISMIESGMLRGEPGDDYVITEDDLAEIAERVYTKVFGDVSVSLDSIIAMQEALIRSGNGGTV